MPHKEEQSLIKAVEKTNEGIQQLKKVFEMSILTGNKGSKESTSTISEALKGLREDIKTMQTKTDGAFFPEDMLVKIRGDQGNPGKDGIKGDPGIKGEKGDKGEKGEKGLDGKDAVTPSKKEFLAMMKPLIPSPLKPSKKELMELMPEPPQKGIDYFTPSEIEQMKLDVRRDVEGNILLPSIEEIARGLEALIGDERLNYSSLKNTPNLLGQRGAGEGISSAVAIFDDGTFVQDGAKQLNFIGGSVAINGEQLDINISGLDSNTFAEISAQTTTTAQSLYTIASGVAVEFESSSNSTILYIDEATARVGIGEASPDGQLHITDVTNGATLYLEGSEKWLIQANNAGLNGGMSIIDPSSNVMVVFASTGTIFPDSKKALFGSGMDLEIFHDGTDSRITNNEGDLYIENDDSNKDIYIKYLDGETDSTAVFVDGSESYMGLMGTTSPTHTLHMNDGTLKMRNDFGSSITSILETGTNIGGLGVSGTGMLYSDTSAGVEGTFIAGGNWTALGGDAHEARIQWFNVVTGASTKIKVIDGEAAIISSNGSVQSSLKVDDSEGAYVKGSTTDTSKNAFRVQNSDGTDLLKIDNSGGYAVGSGGVFDGEVLLNVTSATDYQARFNYDATNYLNIDVDSDGTANFGINQATPAMSLDDNDSAIFAGRIQGSKGADVASADEITLGVDGNLFDITGTTTINHINKTDWQAGSEVTLHFDASVTVTHNAGSPTGTEASILLSGSSNLSATTGDNLTLYYNGVEWEEKGRKIA